MVLVPFYPSIDCLILSVDSGTNYNPINTSYTAMSAKKRSCTIAVEKHEKKIRVSRAYTVEYKHHVLAEVEKSGNLTQTALKYEVPIRLVQKWKVYKDEIAKQARENPEATKLKRYSGRNVDHTKGEKCELPMLEEALLDWMKQQKSVK